MMHLNLIYIYTYMYILIFIQNVVLRRWRDSLVYKVLALYAQGPEFYLPDDLSSGTTCFDSGAGELDRGQTASSEKYSRHGERLC